LTEEIALAPGAKKKGASRHVWGAPSAGFVKALSRFLPPAVVRDTLSKKLYWEAVLELSDAGRE